MARQEKSDLEEILEEYKNSPPEERAQVKALLNLLGITPEEVTKLEAAFAPKNPFRDKQTALDALERNFLHAVAENVG